MGLLKYDLLAVVGPPNVELPDVSTPVLRWPPLALPSIRMRALGVLLCSTNMHGRRHQTQRHKDTKGVSPHSAQGAVSLCNAAVVCDRDWICLQSTAATAEADSSEAEEGEITDEPALQAEAEEGDVRDVRGMRAAASDDEEGLDDDAEEDDGGGL